MPYFDSSQEWLEQSTLLLQARPTTTRVTTRYTPAPTNRRIRLRLKNAASRAATQASTSANDTQSRSKDQAFPQRDSEAEKSHAQSQAPTAASAELVLKTYDPVSGTCLKYRTLKAAEVGRLVAALGSLGREMAGVASAGTDGDVSMTEAVSGGDGAVDDEASGSKKAEPESILKTTEEDTESAGIATAKSHTRGRKSVSFAEAGPAASAPAPEKKTGSGGSGGAPSGGGASGGGGGGGKKKKKGKGK